MVLKNVAHENVVFSSCEIKRGITAYKTYFSSFRLAPTPRLYKMASRSVKVYSVASPSLLRASAIAARCSFSGAAAVEPPSL